MDTTALRTSGTSNDPTDTDTFGGAIRRLRTPERLILTLYYHEGLKLPEIALVLEMAEAEATQLYAQALAALREEIRPLRHAA
jgi:DNA-directed RNA polymerase specialized sigma subunit